MWVLKLISINYVNWHTSPIDLKDRKERKKKKELEALDSWVTVSNLHPWQWERKVIDEAVPDLEVFLSSKAIKGVFDSTVVQKTEDIKEILIRQQCEISL